MFSFQELQTVTYLRNSFFELWSGTALFRSLIHFYSTIFDKVMIQGWGFTPTTIRRTSFAPQAVIFSTTSVQRLAAIASVKVPVHRQQPFKPRPKGVESGSVFSLSFRTFLSLLIRNKRERKVHFYFRIVLHFLFFITKKEKKTKQKKRNDALFSTTLRLWTEWL